MQPESSDSMVEMSMRGESAFSILVDSEMGKDVGRALRPAQADLPMLDFGLGQAHLKWVRSPGPK